jgi:hypothetical protein
MYEMLPLLGNLPSNAFAGLVDDNVVDSDIETDKPSTTTAPQQQQKPIPPTYISGNSGGMYNLRHDID